MAISYTIIFCLTPTNEAGFKLTLQSILEQTIQNFELFILPSKGCKIHELNLMEVIESDPRIRIVQENESLYEDIDGVIRRSTGSQIAYIESGSFWLPNHLRVLSNFFGAQSDCGVFHTFPLLLTPNSEVHIAPSGTIHHGATNRSAMRLDLLPLSTLAHSRDFYLALGRGWRTANSTTHFLEMALSVPLSSMASVPMPTALTFSSSLLNLPESQLEGVQRAWLTKLQAPNTEREVISHTLRSLYTKRLQDYESVVDLERQLQILMQRTENAEAQQRQAELTLGMMKAELKKLGAYEKLLEDQQIRWDTRNSTLQKELSSTTDENGRLTENLAIFQDRLDVQSERIEYLEHELNSMHASSHWKLRERARSSFLTRFLLGAITRIAVGKVDSEEKKGAKRRKQTRSSVVTSETRQGAQFPSAGNG